VPSSDVAPWNLLHNGVVTDVVRDRDRATLVVDFPYLRARFAQPGSRVRVELLDCSLLEYAPYEGAAATGLQDSMEKVAATTRLPADVDREGVDDLLLDLLKGHHDS
jgi:hypothetical protein